MEKGFLRLYILKGEKLITKIRTKQTCNRNRRYQQKATFWNSSHQVPCVNKLTTSKNLPESTTNLVNFLIRNRNQVLLSYVNFKRTFRNSINCFLIVKLVETSIWRLQQISKMTKLQTGVTAKPKFIPTNWKYICERLSLNCICSIVIGFFFTYRQRLWQLLQGYPKAIKKQPQSVFEKKIHEIFITRAYLLFMSSINCSRS